MDHLHNPLPFTQAPTGTACRRALQTRILLWAALTLAVPLLQAELRWDPNRASLTLQVRNQPLPEMLKELSQATGWEVFVDPALNQPVSTRFTNLSIADGLRRALGDLNFALLPQPDRPPQLYVYSSSLQEATLRLASPTPTQSSPPTAGNHELIVRLKPDSTTSIEELAAQLGGKVVGELKDLNGYRIEFPDEATAQQARESLTDDPDVLSSEANSFITSPDTSRALGTASTPPPQLRAKVVPSEEQIIVALLDTPIATDSPELSELLLPAVSVSGEPAAPANSLTHGTAMAETLLRSLAEASNDPEGTPVRILPVDIYGGHEATTTFDVVNGLLAAAEQGADVINLSLGGEEPSPLLQEAVQALRSQGVVVIAAAGNQPTTAEVFPAAYPEVLAVTASDPSGNLATYANRGEFIDLVGPGSSVVQFDNQAYLGTGTSYASAYISGAAAAFLASPEADGAALDDYLRAHYGFRSAPVARP
jgi:hypothetical protein